MSWNLLTFALPVATAQGVLAQLNPASYKELDRMPQSDLSAAVHAIAERVLQAEHVRGSEHFERIEDMLKELPDSAGPKTVQSLLRCRLKVVKTETDEMPVFTAGTDTWVGKYYIGINPDPEMEAALPWVITHELSHILNEDHIGLVLVKAVASLGVAALSTLVLGWALLPSLGAVVFTNCVTHTIFSHRMEGAADDFAIQHCSREQLEKGIACLELCQARRAKGNYKNNLITWILHPSDNSRIAKIRAALGVMGKEKPA